MWYPNYEVDLTIDVHLHPLICTPHYNAKIQRSPKLNERYTRKSYLLVEASSGKDISSFDGFFTSIIDSSCKELKYIC